MVTNDKPRRSDTSGLDEDEDSIKDKVAKNNPPECVIMVLIEHRNDSLVISEESFHEFQDIQLVPTVVVSDNNRDQEDHICPIVQQNRGGEHLLPNLGGSRTLFFY